MPKIFTAILKNDNFWKISALFIAISYVFYLFCSSLSGVLPPFIVAIVGAYAFNEAATTLEKFKISRSGASAIIALSLIIVFALLCMLIWPFLQKQLIMLSRNFPLFAKKIYGIFELISVSVKNVKVAGLDLTQLNMEMNQSLISFLQSSVRFVIKMVGDISALTNLLLFMILTPMLMFYLLKDWGKIVSFFNDCIVEDSQLTKTILLNMLICGR